MTSIQRVFLQWVCVLSVLVFSVVAQAAEVTLAWDASTSPEVTGYRVHYGVVSKTYTSTVDAGNVLNKTVINLTPGQQYFFAATAYDAVGSQSGFSNEIPYTVPTPPVSEKPVAVYGFDAGSGSTLTDTSGMGNHGVITGATWTTQGRFGQALTFDGVDDWITIADSPSLDLTTGMTLEAWVFPTVVMAGSVTVLMKEQPSHLSYVLFANNASNRPSGEVFVGTGFYTVQGLSALPVNTWTHIAATYNNTVLQLYINGILVSSKAVTGPIVTSENVFRIGGNSVWSYEDFKGHIDEIRIYNRALTATEIQTDMATPVTPAEAPIANFTGTPLMGKVPLAVAFTNTTTGDATSWSWNFGNGATSTVQHPSHNYMIAGVYTVTLTATGPGGTHTETKVNYVAATATVVLKAPTEFRIAP